MLKSLVRTGAALLIAVSFGLQAVPAVADGVGDAMSQSVVQGANIGIKNAMDAQQQKKAPTTQPVTQKSDSGSKVAQVPPIQQVPVGPVIGLPTGFTYTADITTAWPMGDIGTTGRDWLPGGVDLVAAYGFNPTTRFVAQTYQLQHYPVGFNTGQVPVYLRGFANPIGCASLDNTTGPTGTCTPTDINVATKDSINLFNLEKLFLIGGLPGGKKLPIIVTPTYIARVSKIAQSAGNADIVPFAINPPDGPTFYGVKTRTAQLYSVAVTLPFLKTPKMFGTFTAAPSWLVHLNGANIQNHAQIYQILYVEYHPYQKLNFFLEPQSSRDYLPTDQYAQHLIAYFAGAQWKFNSYSFFQLTLNSGGPTNEGAYGVHSLMCDNLGQAAAGTCPVNIGGLKATQIQFAYGIGSPSVIPF